MIQQQFLTFEHPLNERMRTFLRTEYLFQLAKFRYNNLANEWDARDCVVSVIELYNIIERTEFRGELVKELERTLGNLHRLSATPSVNHLVLEKAMKDIESALEGIRNTSKQGFFPRSDLLTSIRQRLMIAGGTCPFDIPAFYFWLNLPAKTRQQHLNQWIEILEPLERALALALALVRESSLSTKETAVAGIFQKSLNAQNIPQLLRLVLRAESGVYPEVSANKHRVNIRFLDANFEVEKNSVCTQDIRFEFACCVI